MNTSEAHTAEILIVEDNLMDFKIIQRAFDALPFQTNLYHVIRGESAIEFLYKTGQYKEAPTPDLVLLDLDLPGITGHDVLLQIKTAEKLKTIPVIVLTTSYLMEDIKKAYSNWANGYLTKDSGLGKSGASFVDALVNYWFSLVRLPTGKVFAPNPDHAAIMQATKSSTRILCIDDNTMHSKMIAAAARQLHFRWSVQQVSSVEDGYTILKAPCNLHPDLILIDLNLPNQDVKEFLKRVKGSEDTRSIHIVAYTQSADDEAVNESYQNHINAFIPKPDRIEDALKILTSISQWYKIVRTPGSMDSG
jgi:CheY-like chemotaxis protein